YELHGARARFIHEKEIKTRFPRAYGYLLQNKPVLQGREKGKMRGRNWYAYVYPKNIDVMRSRKILVPDIAERASFALDDSGAFAFVSGYGIILKAELSESPKYILGLLNSRVLDFYLKAISTTLRGGFFRYFTQFIERLPIRTIDLFNPADKARHDRIVVLVERMLQLNKRKHSGKLAPSQIDRVDREIGATDEEIDDLVYDLYAITDEERKIIEDERS
ncbi:MAG: TaqI-like C-terminal specificity domain-containing protein, partial [Terriglobia bacterium]